MDVLKSVKGASDISGMRGMLGTIIVAIVVILFFFSTMGIIIDEVAFYANESNSNLTSTEAGIVGLIPMLWVLIPVFIIIAVVYKFV